MTDVKDGFGHETPNKGATNSWITPKWIFDGFNLLVPSGEFFDLDPCISTPQPWKTATTGYNEMQNGLIHSWFGTVWCNPPYGDEVYPFAEKMAEHNDGIMLIFARTETKVWQQIIFPYSDTVFFFDKRIIFHYPDGTPARNKKGAISSAGAPSTLVAFGKYSTDAISRLIKLGKLSGHQTKLYKGE